MKGHGGVRRQRPRALSSFRCQPLEQAHGTRERQPDDRVKGAVIGVASHAADRWYSWMRPPGRSRRRISPSGDLSGRSSGSGGPSSSARWQPLAVVVIDIEPEDTFGVTAVEDQQPVETLRADGLTKRSGDRVRLRRPHRRLLNPDGFAAEHLVEADAVLAVAVTNRNCKPWSEKSRPRLRASWVTQAPGGCGAAVEGVEQDSECEREDALGDAEREARWCFGEVARVASVA
jgi:hypothetical protein